MAKYKIPVAIQTIASKYIGTVECDSIEEYKEKAADLWESQDFDYPTVNITNDFDLNDWDILAVNKDDLKYYKDET